MGLPASILPATVKLILIVSIFSYPQPAMSRPHNNLTDLESLLAFKAAVTDPYGILATNWTTNASICTWIGVSCGRKHQRVIALRLPNITLQGTISPHLANLSFLSHLSLNNNSLAGSIPHTIDRLPRLGTLAIQNNHLSGPIPSSVFNMTSLVSVSFSFNNLSGSLSSIDRLSLPPWLQILSLSGNHLTGRIPPSIAHCSRLQVLSLSRNELSGSIPPELGNLTELNLLFLGENRFTGTIPASIGNLTKLTKLDLPLNYLEGSIPEELGTNQLDLQYLNLCQNFLSGPIPMALLNASKLYSLQLQINNLTGTIPTTLGNSWPQLTTLKLFMNQLTGGLEFITSLTNCRYLTDLSVASNEIQGVVPNCIGNLSVSLNMLDFSYNHIKGNIDAGFGNFSNLIGLYLDSNDLTGEIPSTFSRLENLQQMALNDNKISGSIPSEIGLMASLSLFYLFDNNISGSIPYSLGNISGLTNLVLGGNRIVSNIPNSLWSLDDLVELDLSMNAIDGSLSPNMGNLKSLNKFDLSKNRLSGNISSALGDLQMLEYLDLSSNFFHGQIPGTVKKLINVEHMNLSYNSLSGVIPKSLANLSRLDSLDLSFNKLEGQIPEGRVFTNLSIVFLKGNEGLCGALKLGFLPCPTIFATPNSKSKLHLLKYIFPIIASVIILLSCFCVLLIYRRRGTTSKFQSTDTSMNKFRMISYHELVRATNNFSNANLLGRGSFSSVFKACLDDGSITAVKVLNIEDQAALRSFDVECIALRNVRHRNLVKTISACSNLDFKALVLQFMPNGSLEQWLYSHNYYLNLLQRLSIMVDVSLAFEYLHHLHPHVIVHCDLKPSNVLLDENMVAHVSDFGISKLLLDDSKPILSASAPGTFGYMAPEYGTTGKASRKSDVYSFGILLLETLTRKKPSDAMFGGELSLRQWVTEAYPDAVLEIVDPNLLTEDFSTPQQQDPLVIVHHCLSSLIELGLQCTVNSPKERMLMKDVVPILQKTKVKYLSKLPSA